MPLSKERNKRRMRKIRLQKAISSPQTLKIVQPEPVEVLQLDADGNVIPEYD